MSKIIRNKFHHILMVLIIIIGIPTYNGLINNRCLHSKFNATVYSLLAGSNKELNENNVQFTTSNSSAYRLKSCPYVTQQCCLPSAEEYFLTTGVQDYLFGISGISSQRLSYLRYRQHFLRPFHDFFDHFLFQLNHTLVKSLSLSPIEVKAVLHVFKADILSADTLETSVKTLDTFLTGLTVLLITNDRNRRNTHLHVNQVWSCVVPNTNLDYDLNPFLLPLAEKISAKISFGLSEMAGLRIHYDAIIDILSRVESLKLTDDCTRALTRMRLCSACSGHLDTPPCPGLCNNVLHGCLSPVIRMKANWEQYLVGLNSWLSLLKNQGLLLEKAFDIHKFRELVKKGLETFGSRKRAIFQSLNKRCVALIKISRRPPYPLDPLFGSTKRDNSGYIVQKIRHSQRDQLIEFIKRVNNSTGIFQPFQLNKVCNSAPKDSCWNGLRLGRYTKEVGYFNEYDQSHNPEMKSTDFPSLAFTQNMTIHLSVDIDRRIQIMSGKSAVDQVGDGKPPPDDDYGEGSGLEPVEEVFTVAPFTSVTKSSPKKFTAKLNIMKSQKQPSTASSISSLRVLITALVLAALAPTFSVIGLT